MSFEFFFEKINLNIKLVKSLEDLVVRKRRKNIGNAGSSFKEVDGHLSEIKYNVYLKEKHQRNIGT
tara:strand:+ start:1193 stop:1390 length:198 start_codon:yes stop_codon:yes gene_type:complete